MEFAVILAGGTGKRLWPLSRQKRPKQVLRILNGQTLLRSCFERLQRSFDLRNILVLTNEDFVDAVRENLLELPEDNVIAEPVVRDTAGAIGLAAAILSKFDADSTMAVMTADQILEPPEVFETALRTGLSFVHERPEALVTFAVKPTFPSTQFGYIKLGDPVPFAESRDAVRRVETFQEKPDEATAYRYVESGRYYWNSGMFVWKCRTILEQLRRYLPDCIEPLRNIQLDWGTPQQRMTLKEWFGRLPKISIDYAVLEKATNVYAIPLDCRWLDLGSFAALGDIIRSDADNNIVVAEHIELLDCKNNIVVTEDKNHLIALIGLDNMIVAHSPDATLVCPATQARRIQDLLEQIQRHGQEKFL
ncbi:MAG: mannose-1-phosphate guanylyltransferase [Planctomycetes bacterium]|jgi:mannose-1-phosphate guanylyltransferase|nr:mannose-1-phosphate guanylyltransferase [Planctomycetota bacterium]